MLRQQKSDSMSDVRVDMWSTKMDGKSVATAPELKNLASTTEVFEMYVRRAHMET